MGVSYNDLAAMTIASAARGDVFIRGATGIQRLGAGTARQLFRTGGTGANPSWNDLIGTRIASTTTQGSAIYEDANGRIARLAPPTAAGAVLETRGSNAHRSYGSNGAASSRPSHDSIPLALIRSRLLLGRGSHWLTWVVAVAAVAGEPAGDNKMRMEVVVEAGCPSAELGLLSQPLWIDHRSGWGWGRWWS